MNWWRPLRTGHELVLFKFVRLILKSMSNWARGHATPPGGYVANCKLGQRTNGAI